MKKQFTNQEKCSYFSNKALIELTELEAQHRELIADSNIREGFIALTAEIRKLIEISRWFHKSDTDQQLKH